MKKCISLAEIPGRLTRAPRRLFTLAAGVVALAAISPGITNGQPKTSEGPLPQFTSPTIDNAVQAFMVRNNVPGISLAIARDEKTVYVKSYGFADTENRTLLTPRHLFRIASISKPITSIAIMKLVEEKKLSLDSKVFGPKGILKNKYGRSPYKEGITDITVRQLLQHISGGWTNDGTDPMFTDPSRGIDELISFTLNSYLLQNKPGTHYAYSNFGYCVLGRVIETVTGENYESYVKRAVLAPVGVTNMQVGGNTLEEKRRNEVTYYGQQGEDPYRYNITRMDAHGGWIASATDLLKIMNHADGADGVKDILAPETVRTMLTAPAVSPGYACGWAVDSLGNFQHGGSLPGTRTELRHRTNGYAYAVLLNTRAWDTAFTQGFTRMMQVIQGVEIPFPAAVDGGATASEATIAAAASAGTANSTKRKYGLTPISSLAAYRELVAQDARQELVDLEKYIPGIVLDIRYATPHNIMKRPVYTTSAAFMRRPAADALKNIQQELNKKGYGLKIYDGYRPYDVTVIFYEQFHDTTFVASPYTGSRHNRGCAVDLTIIDLKTGKELEMPTPYDSFTREAHSAFAGLPVNIRKNRELLQQVMLKHGFVIYPDEWWHFDFAGWQQYPIMNISFETLRF